MWTYETSLARDATNNRAVGASEYWACWAHADVVKEARPSKHTGSIPMSALKRIALQTSAP